MSSLPSIPTVFYALACFCLNIRQKTPAPSHSKARDGPRAALDWYPEFFRTLCRQGKIFGRARNYYFQLWISLGLCSCVLGLIWCTKSCNSAATPAGSSSLWMYVEATSTMHDEDVFRRWWLANDMGCNSHGNVCFRNLPHQAIWQQIAEHFGHSKFCCFVLHMCHVRLHSPQWWVLCGYQNPYREDQSFYLDANPLCDPFLRPFAVDAWWHFAASKLASIQNEA